MQSFFPRDAICAASLVFLLSPAFAQQPHQHVMANPGDMTWKDGPPSLPKGAQMALLYGDPSKDGIFVMRLKFPANYKIPAHTHPTDEVVTVISGEFSIGMGATVLVTTQQRTALDYLLSPLVANFDRAFKQR